MSISLPDLQAKVRIDTTDLHSGLNRASESTSRFGGMLKTGIGLAAVAAGGALVAMGGFAAKTGIQTAASMEQAQIAFKTLLGSADKAKTFLGGLSSFAAKTPFELPGLIDASRQLLGVGQSAESVIPTLTALGNTSGALGLSQEQFSRSMLAVTQSMGKGKIQAEELMQITEAGIPIWSILSQALGKPIPELQKLSQQGKLMAEDTWPKVFAQMNKNYGGAMEAQSKTLTGVWSTLTDTVKMSLATAFQPLVPILTKIIPGAATFAGNAITGLSKSLQNLGPSAQSAVAGNDKLAAVAEKVKSNFEALRSLFSKVFTDIQSVVEKNKATFKEWGDRITSSMKSVQEIISSVIAILTVLWDHGGKRMLEIIAIAFGGILKIIQGVLQIIAGVLKIFVGIFTGDWGMAWEGMKQIWQGLWNVIRGILEVALGVILMVLNNALTILTTLFGTTMSLLWSLMQSAWSGITAGTAAAWNGILWLLQGAWAGITVGATATWNGIMWFLTGTWNVIRGTAMAVWNAITGFFQGMWARIVGLATGFVNGVMNAIHGLAALPGMFAGWFGGAYNAASSALGRLLSLVAGLPGRILGALGNLGSLLFGAGEAIVNGLIHGIQSAAGAIASAVRSIVDKIPGPIRKIMGIASPSKVMFKIGQQIGQGIPRGMKDQLKNVKTAALNLTQAVTANTNPSSAANSTSTIFSPTINVQGTTSPAEIMEEIKWSYRFAGS